MLHLNRSFQGYYKDNIQLPIFSSGTKTATPEKKVKTLLFPHAPERLCQVVPTNICDNVTFLLSTLDLKSWEDWKCDDMGAWRNNGVKRDRYTLNNVGKVKRLGGRSNTTQDTVYTLVRNYYKNKTSCDLKKCVTYLEGTYFSSNIFLYFVLCDVTKKTFFGFG